MTPAIFIDLPTILKVKNKETFPLYRTDWSIPASIITLLTKHVKDNYKIFLVGNYPNIPVRRRDSNPIETLFIDVANHLEKELKIQTNSIGFEYSTDKESFDYLPLPGMFYTLASDHEILLSYSFFYTTNLTIGKFVQQYSSVKPIII